MGVFEESSFGVPGECRCCGVKKGMSGTGVLRLDGAIAVVNWFALMIERKGRYSYTHWNMTAIPTWSIYMKNVPFFFHQ